MDRKKKVIVITAYPFNKRDYDRFGIELLRHRGLIVEIWDITSYLYKNFKDQLVEENPADFKGLKVFTDKKEIINAIATLDNDCLINCFFEYSIRSFAIFRTISKHGIDYCIFSGVTYPSLPPIRDSFIGRIGSLLKKGRALKIREIFNHVLNKILLEYYYLFGIAPASIHFVLGGDKSMGSVSYPVNETTIYLWAHYLDYDIFLQNKNDPVEQAKITGVFLDQYLPFHPDCLYMGSNFPLSPDDYYPKLCYFFDILEQKTKAEIVIAAHPKADYDHSPDYFCGRSIFKGDTLHLVRESSFVLAHSSTAIDFAVLYNKPLLFLTTDDLEKMVSGKNIIGVDILAMSSELGKIPLNMDHVSGIDWENAMKVDVEIYRQYRDHYIKKQGTPEKQSWDIFSSFIQQMDIL
jgi:hypothetical protein